MATGKKSRCLIPGLQGAGIFTPSCSRGALSRGVLKAEQDTASRVRASQAQAREVLGHRPAPLRGSATSWLDAVQVKAKKFAGCAGTSRPQPVPGSAVLKPKTAGTERRKAFPRPLVSGDPEITLRHNDQGAPLGAPAPHVEGGRLKHTSGSQEPRECGGVLTGRAV